MSARHAAVLGRPVAHSLSPVLHRAAYAALGLDWTYDAIDCGAQELAAVLERRHDWVGVSCTMPLKHEALAIATEVRDAARLVGAANTLLPLAGRGWIADNTDVDGVTGALFDSNVQVDGATQVAVLGAGGTAQAVLVALARLQVRAAVVYLRDRARAEALLATAARAGITIELRPFGDPVDPGLVGAGFGGPGLIVSTLPPGAADPLAQMLTHHWSADIAVLDVVYDPWPTSLAIAAETAGGTVISGALMLLHQAAAQVALMTGRPAPIASMRAALRSVAPGAGV